MLWMAILLIVVSTTHKVDYYYIYIYMVCDITPTLNYHAVRIIIDNFRSYNFIKSNKIMLSVFWCHNNVGTTEVNVNIFSFQPNTLNFDGKSNDESLLSNVLDDIRGILTT